MHGHPFEPPLGAPPDWGLADYVVKEKLFAFWLTYGCVPGSEEHALMRRMVDGGGRRNRSGVGHCCRARVC